MTDIGENYQYAKTIVENTIELKKIDFAENTASLASKMVVSLLLGVLGIISLIILVIISGMWIYQLTDSIMMTLAILILINVILAVIVIASRRRLIYQPITKAIYSKLLNIND